MNEYYDLSYIVGMGGERKLPITAILPSAPSEAPVMASRHADATIPDDVDSLRHLVRCDPRQGVEAKLRPNWSRKGGIGLRALF